MHEAKPAKVEPVWKVEHTVDNPAFRTHGLRLVDNGEGEGVAALCKCGWMGASQHDEDGARADYKSHVGYEEARRAS